MIKCPNCTGEMTFNPTDQVIKCDWCGSTFKASELHEKLKGSKETVEKKVDDKSGKETITGTAYSCSQCGAEILTFDDTAVTFCSYCGSQAMLLSRMIEETAPDYIIPFKKDKNECIESYRKTLKKSLFAPDYFKNDTTVEKFRGIYIPYVVYKFGYKGAINSSASKYSHRSGDYVIYDLFKLKANADVEYEGMSYDLISKYYDKFSESIPFNFKEREDFNPNYLIGFYADRGDVDKGIYEQEAISEAKEDAKDRFKKQKEFSRFHNIKGDIDLVTKERKVGMFPLYFLAIRDKTGTKVSYAIVNGQTGEVAADIPVSFKKYVGFSMLMSILVFILINAYIVLTPVSISIIAMVFAVINFVISAIQLESIRNERDHTFDKGFVSQNKDKVKEKEILLTTLRYVYKELLAFSIPMLVFLANPVDDYYYYGAAIISIILDTLSFSDLIKEHNLLVSNKLPQLEKRGGDENA